MANDANAQKAQNFTNRGRQALEAGRFELAVEMLSQALECAPDTLETRRLLRAAQIAQFRRSGGGMDGTTSAAARNVVVKVMARSPSMSIATSADVNPW